MKISEKHHKKVKKMMEENKKTPTKKKETSNNSLPIWFNENHDVEEISEEEQNELDTILKELV